MIEHFFLLSSCLVSYSLLERTLILFQSTQASPFTIQPIFCSCARAHGCYDTGSMARTVQSHPRVLLIKRVCIADRIDRLPHIWQRTLPSSAHTFERIYYRPIMVIPITVASVYHLDHGIHMGFERQRIDFFKPRLHECLFLPNDDYVDPYKYGYNGWIRTLWSTDNDSERRRGGGDSLWRRTIWYGFDRTHPSI